MTTDTRTLVSVIRYDWLVLWNLPGCLPKMYPVWYATWDEARDALRTAIESLADELDDDGDADKDALASLRALDYGTDWGQWVRGYYYSMTLDLQSTEHDVDAILHKVESSTTTAETLSLVVDESTYELCAVSLDAFATGGCGGFGALGVANRRALEDADWYQRMHAAGIAVQRTGYYESRWVLVAEFLFNLSKLTADDCEALATWIGYESDVADSIGEQLRDDALELIDMMRKLENYPCLDDEGVSDVESEWQDEAWDQGIHSNFEGALANVLDDPDAEESNEAEVAEWIGSIPNMRDYFDELASEVNEYWESAYNSAYIDADAVANKGLLAVRDDFRCWLLERAELASGIVGHPTLPFPTEA